MCSIHLKNLPLANIRQNGFVHSVRFSAAMASDQFVDYLEDQAGPALRVVTWYAEDDYGGLYIRGDLDREAVIDRVRFLSERLIRADGPIEGSPLEALGEQQAMVQVRENVVILRFPLEKTKGIVVSMDVDAARDLHGFVLGCHDLLRDTSISFRSNAI